MKDKALSSIKRWQGLSEGQWTRYNETGKKKMKKEQNLIYILNLRTDLIAKMNYTLWREQHDPSNIPTKSGICIKEKRTHAHNSQAYVVIKRKLRFMHKTSATNTYFCFCFFCFSDIIFFVCFVAFRASKIKAKTKEMYLVYILNANGG